MSILDRVNKQEQAPQGKKLFGVVAGVRLGGKTTLSATLPGKTLLLQAAVLESGSGSAEKLARDLGNELRVLNFTDLKELSEILVDLATDTYFDNIYVDGLSAIADLKAREPKVAALIEKQNWDGFRLLGNATVDLILGFKSLTYPGKAAKPKNVFLTCALTVKLDKTGAIADVSLEVPGNMTVTAITKLGECVLTTILIPTESGVQRKLITKTREWWPGRIDGVLDDKNPGLMDPDLSKVLDLISN